MAQIIFTIPDTKRRLNGEFYKRTGSMDYWDLNYVHDPIRATELPRSCHEVATLNRINRQYISADTSATRHVPDPGPDRAGRSRPTHPPIPHTRAHPRSHYNARAGDDARRSSETGGEDSQERAAPRVRGHSIDAKRNDGTKDKDKTATVDELRRRLLEVPDVAARDAQLVATYAKEVDEKCVADRARRADEAVLKL